MVAALLKLAGSGVSVYAQFGWLLSANVQVAIIAWELLLGFALILGWHRPVAWLLALVTFTGFALVSGYLGVIGQASCGCFGSVQASPWAAFGLDVGMILGLGIFRPRFSRNEFQNAVIATTLWSVALSMILGFLIITGVILFGSIAATVANLRGDSLSVDRTHVEFGRGHRGEQLSQQISITNCSDHPINIVGGTADCICITTSELPMHLQPNETKQVTVYFKLIPSDQIGIANRTAWLITDNPNQPKLTLSLSASVD